MLRFESDPRLRAEFFRLQLQFLGNANRDVAEVFQLLEAAGAEVPSGEAGERLRQISHGLRGAGGSYGFDDVTTTAGQLEEACLSAATAAELRAAAAALEHAVESARETLERECGGV